MTLVSDLQQRIKGVVGSEEKVLEEASQDFGGIVSKKPAVVVRPRCSEDVIEVVRFADVHRLPLGLRGGGHSQSGQCLNQDGLIMDMRSLSRILALDTARENVLVEGGILWG